MVRTAKSDIRVFLNERPSTRPPQKRQKWQWYTPPEPGQVDSLPLVPAPQGETEDEIILAGVTGETEDEIILAGATEETPVSIQVAAARKEGIIIGAAVVLGLGVLYSVLAK